MVTAPTTTDAPNPETDPAQALNRPGVTSAPGTPERAAPADSPAPSDPTAISPSLSPSELAALDDFATIHRHLFQANVLDTLRTNDDIRRTIRMALRLYRGMMKGTIPYSDSKLKVASLALRARTLHVPRPLTPRAPRAPRPTNPSNPDRPSGPSGRSGPSGPSGSSGSSGSSGPSGPSGQSGQSGASGDSGASDSSNSSTPSDSTTPSPSPRPTRQSRATQPPAHPSHPPAPITPEQFIANIKAELPKLEAQLESYEPTLLRLQQQLTNASSPTDRQSRYNRLEAFVRHTIEPLRHRITIYREHLATHDL